MTEALRYLIDYEVFIYISLGIFGLWQMRKFAKAWEELRSAAFGLEREYAQMRLNRAAGMLVFVLVIAVVEFALVSFVAPSVPGAQPIFTPTVDLLATPTITLQADVQETVQPTPAAAGTPEPLPLIPESSCIPGQIEITSPAQNETVRGVVEIMGTVDVPNFGFYKFEMTPVGETFWQTIQAGDEITQEDSLGFWDTTLLARGEYQLRLVVTDNEGGSFPPCIIQLNIVPPEE